MNDLFANASEPERHLSRVAADVWGCAPYIDHQGTRYPLAMDAAGIVTAWHPTDATGIHAVQVVDHSPDEQDNPSATVLHSMYATAPAPMPWRHACEQVHALVQQAVPLPFEGTEPTEKEIAFRHAQTDQLAFTDGAGMRVDVRRLVNDSFKPTTGPPFWKIVVWVDAKPIASREVNRPSVTHARAAALREHNTFEGTAPAIRRLADARGWAAVRQHFRAA